MLAVSTEVPHDQDRAIHFPERWAWVCVLLVTLLGTLYLRDQQVTFNADHGNDLYAAWAVTHGLVPYRDFHWIYGPLAPYGLAIGFWLFEPSIQGLRTFCLSALIVGAVLTCHVGRRVLTPALSVAVSCMVFAWGIPYQHYHYCLAVPVIAFGLLSLIRHMETDRMAWVGALALASTVLVGLKLTLGVAVGLAWFTACFLHRLNVARQQGRGLTAAALPLLGWIFAWVCMTCLLYAPFVSGLDREQLRLCFPFSIFWATDPKKPWIAARALYDIFYGSLVSGQSPPAALFLNRGLALPFLYSGVMLWFLPKLVVNIRRCAGGQRYEWGMTSLWLLAAGGGAEFVIRGTYYSLFQFATVPTLLLCGLLLKSWLARPRLDWLWLVVGLGGFLSVCRAERPHPSVWFADSRAQVYLPQLQSIPTLLQAATFLEAHLRPGEPIAVFPYAPQYFFMSDRRSGTWRHNFNPEWPPSDREEQEIIQRLQGVPVRCVIVTNTAGLLTGFGSSYARQVWAFLRRRYVPVQVLGVGPWAQARDGTHTHKAVILWRSDAPLPAKRLEWPGTLPG